ncbi:copper resistance protein B [Salinisphaera sp.]|uniref:copper resistance protein B n=1 Tax=Salinisphaera sp. TaxID=1914330 RepID=UPI002D77A41E|nr:copper resistance protein B [Salinisphaera sp.]HET7314992.1 copper resistance protein B [Salinisphaera sp.]
MSKAPSTLRLTAFTALLGAAGFAHAGDRPPGKAEVDTVVPDVPTDPNSGAPAYWAARPANNNPIHHFFLLDRAEYGATDGPDSYLWDAEGWIGGDYNKFWFETEGEGPIDGGSPESTRFEAKYARLIAPFFTAQAGLRYDINPGDDRGFAVVNLTGLAPYRFEADNSLYVSEHGDVSFVGEYEYELLFTQRLVLAPRAAFTAAASDAPEYGLGSGLRSTEMGLRLRYQIRREFAPYIGVRWEQQYGDTKDMAEAAGEPTSSTAFVIGIRAWY